MDNQESHDSLKGIAVIGMAGRFPGAKSTDEFWQNLSQGRESISFFTDEELLSEGVDPTLLHNPHYVKAGVDLSDIEMFDASFFGFTPREAEVMDPQHRLFLECAWEALENAGYDPETYEELIGVYAGSNLSTYLLNNLISNHDLLKSLSGTIIVSGNDKDHIPTRVSYKLNLKGPSLNVSTACSTSLVAIHLACQGLLSYQCDMALAGGIAVRVLQNKGYLYQEDGMTSPDGHCRTFDAKAQGTVFGNGMGIVVLKRLEEALANGDCIYAVIKGSAINNDGSLKVGYTAPSVDGQAAVIAEAQAIAEFAPETITYVECHGTGTVLGDPIEVRALKKVFSAGTNKKRFCAIGSVKTNIGHLDRAAGVTSLIKTVLALKHKQIPPSLHFEQPNPEIDFANSPFYVNTKLFDWKTNGTPRRAGVSSFGIGGTNAHVILEEAPVVEPSDPARPWQLLLLSAKTSTALETATANLATHLKQHPDLNLADVAYTLSVGRRNFDHRRMLVCQDLEDAVKALSTQDPQRLFTHYQKPCNRSVVFMFPGQGAQYVEMGQELYQSEPIFREQVDKCSYFLKPHLGIDLRSVLYPSKEQIQKATQQLKQTHITQAAIFVIEYSLAQLWMAWGVRPFAMIGHSIGEYVAACLAGVFSLEDALALVAVRGQLMQQMPAGDMLAVPLSEKQVQSMLGEELALAAINAPSLSVVSGSRSAIDELHNSLTEQEVDCRRLHTSGAFHSHMMQPIIEPFMAQVKKINLQAPQIPFVSNVTGTWIAITEATDPSYWAKHLRQTVRFAEGITLLLQKPEQILLEVGPGRTLSTLVRQHPEQDEQQIVLSSLRHPKEQQSDVAFLLNTLSRLWLTGAEIDWSGFYANERRYRIPLPTYPFERQRYWIEPQPSTVSVTTYQEPLHKERNLADWFYIPVWKESQPLEFVENAELTKQKSCWLVFVDNCDVGSLIVKRLQQQGQDVITVMVGDKFTKLCDRAYCINPQQKDDYDALLQTLRERDFTPRMIAHLWGITANNQTPFEIESFETNQALGFYSLLFLAQALGQQGITDPLQILVVTNNIYDVTGDESLCPDKATVLGPCKVIGQEYPNITCRNIDIVISKFPTWQQEKLIDQLVAEFTAQSNNSVIAYRGHHRWIQTFEAVGLGEASPAKTRLRQKGVYLITGGLGGIGLILAEYLAQTMQAKLVLVGRSGLPEKDEWEKWLATHDDQDAVSRKIKKVQALEQLGAEVLVKSADVANLEQMQSVIALVTEHFGEIHGVIHAAGIVGENSQRAIQETYITDCQCQFQPKAHGLFVLEKVLQGKALDFCVLLSSLASILGGLGYVAYSAANIFMDAFAHKQSQTNPVPWISINWDMWQLREKEEQNTTYQTTLARLAIMPTKGVEVFQRILSKSTVNQVVVSTGDLQARIEQWLKLESSRNIEQNNSSQDELALSSIAKPTHPRPNLGNDYVAPRTHVEQTIANIWQQLLGIEQIGIHDNFFELGGHSLLATQVISQLRKAFPVELSLRSIFFEYSTIVELGELIEKMVMEKIEQLSEEEAQLLLGV
ncbi:MAG: SDR family oxidoreductase [Brasilonema angustatum HA4187-MV1]|jgi:acyl transferase domain-containing protein|nr:SDR family oxidoreductase [Brasilonema angustatum HA4187-MV1]